MDGKAVNKIQANNVENPTPRDSPNNECITKANAQDTFGLAVWRGQDLRYTFI